MENSTNIKQSFVIVNYLKGFGILAVIIIHYINIYYLDSNTGLAGGIVSIFFILSGFGSYYALNKKIPNEKYQASKIIKYYLEKITRIFPLYILAITLSGITNLLSLDILLFLSIKPQFIYWFVTAIMHCYLVSPLIFLFLKKFGIKNYLIFTTLTFIIINYFIFNLPYFTELNTYPILRIFRFTYKNLAFAHIYLFSLGMTIPYLIKYKKNKLLNNKFNFYFSIIIFITFIYITRINHITKSAYINFFSAKLFPFIFLIIAFIFVFLFICQTKHFPLAKLLAFTGAYSYSIYLFHIIYYELILGAHFVANNFLIQTLVTMLLLPLFVYIVARLEKISCIFSNRKRIVTS